MSELIWIVVGLIVLGVWIWTVEIRFRNLISISSNVGQYFGDNVRDRLANHSDRISLLEEQIRKES